MVNRALTMAVNVASMMADDKLCSDRESGFAMLHCANVSGCFKNCDGSRLQSAASVSGSDAFATVTTSSPSRYRIFQYVEQVCAALEDDCTPDVVVLDDATKFQVLQLVHEILHYKSVVEEMLTESSFYSRFFHLFKDSLLVTVMAYALMKDKFNTKPPTDWGRDANIFRRTIDVAIALWNHRVKLGATLARIRVREGAAHISELIPHSTRESFIVVSNEPICTRVNNANCLAALTRELCMVNNFKILSSQRASFMLEKNLLALSADCKGMLWESNMITDGILTPQDLMSYNCVSSLQSLFHSEENGSMDVLITNSDSGAIPMQIAAMLKGYGKVYVCGVPPMHTKKLEKKFKQASIYNFELLPVLFTNLSPKMEIFENVKVIFCNPPCSLTAVKQPVDFIMQEGDEFISQLLAPKDHGTAHKMSTLTQEQKMTLSCALTFDQTVHVAYFVRSIDEHESRAILEGALAEQCPELFELSSFSLNKSMNKSGEDYFLCTLKHLPPKIPLTASEVISNAIGAGILSGEGLSYESKATKHKKKKHTPKKVFSQHEGIPLTISAQMKVKRRVKSSTSCNKPRPFI